MKFRIHFIAGNTVIVTTDDSSMFKTWMAQKWSMEVGGKLIDFKYVTCIEPIEDESK